MLAPLCVSIIPPSTPQNGIDQDSVGKAGLGKDIWTLEFSQITRILYVCSPISR